MECGSLDMTGLILSKTASPNISFMVLISESSQIRIGMLSFGGLVSIPSTLARLGSVFGKESSVSK